MFQNLIQNNSWGIPGWMEQALLLCAIFAFIIFASIIISLTAALILLARYIRQNRLSKSGQVNKQILALHIATNLCSNCSLVYLMYSLYLWSDPNQSCEKMLKHLNLFPDILVYF
jgi:di/tricarboxylate transporter